MNCFLLSNFTEKNRFLLTPLCVRVCSAQCEDSLTNYIFLTVLRSFSLLASHVSTLIHLQYISGNFVQLENTVSYGNTWEVWRVYLGTRSHRGDFSLFMSLELSFPVNILNRFDCFYLSSFCPSLKVVEEFSSGKAQADLENLFYWLWSHG